MENVTAAYALCRVATAVTAARQRRRDDDRWMIDNYWAHGLAALLWLTAHQQHRDPLQRTLSRLDANPWPAVLLSEWWDRQFEQYHAARSTPRTESGANLRDPHVLQDRVLWILRNLGNEIQQERVARGRWQFAALDGPTEVHGPVSAAAVARACRQADPTAPHTKT